jgi:hypothetical protein
MASGGRRPGAGRPRKTLDEHLLRGTFRPARHGHLLRQRRAQTSTAPPQPVNPLDRFIKRSSLPETLPAPVDSQDLPPMPPTLLDGLGEPGRRFVADVWCEYEGWTGAETVLLRQAARALDDAETAIDARGRRMAVRLFAALVAQLRIGEKR